MNGKFNFILTGYQLKIIALLTMLIDHIGVLCPDVSFLRDIGRVSFPIFAFLLSEGYHFTKNKKKYFLRILVFSFLSEIPFNLFFLKTPFSFSRQNIFFTLAFAFLSIFLYEKCKEKKKDFFSMLGLLCIALIAELLHFDYGAFGVLFVFSFYFHYFLEEEGWWKKIKAFSPIAEKSGKFIFPILTLICFKRGLPWALFSFIPLFLYEGERGRSVKYSFYIFYPVHLLLLTFPFSFLS